jgi:hypothetical protein
MPLPVKTRAVVVGLVSLPAVSRRTARRDPPRRPYRCEKNPERAVVPSSRSGIPVHGGGASDGPSTRNGQNSFPCFDAANRAATINCTGRQVRTARPRRVLEKVTRPIAELFA